MLTLRKWCLDINDSVGGVAFLLLLEGASNEPLPADVLHVSGCRVCADGKSVKGGIFPCYDLAVFDGSTSFAMEVGGHDVGDLVGNCWSLVAGIDKLD
jgi:hypothetical protein